MSVVRKVGVRFTRGEGEVLANCYTKVQAQFALLIFGNYEPHEFVALEKWATLMD